MLRVALLGGILRPEVQAAKKDVHLLCRPPAANEFIALGDEVIDDVFIDLGEMGLPRQQLRLARWLFERPGHLQLYPVHHAVLPMGRGAALVQDMPAQLPLLEDVWPRAR